MQLSVGSKWQKLAGYAYGLGQPAILGDVVVAHPDYSGLEELDPVFTGWFLPGNSPPSGIQDTGDFFRWLFFWLDALHVSLRSPVVDFGYLIETAPLPENATLCRVALPWMFDAKSSVQVLQWLLRAVQDLSRRSTGSAMADGIDRHFESYINLQKDFEGKSIKGVNTLRMMRHAAKYKVPFRSLDGHLMRYGQGRNERLLTSTTTDRTSSIGIAMARNKVLAAKALRQAGLPVPDHFRVKNEDEARQAARELGFPVVVKPADREGGKGVFAGLEDARAVEQACRKASEFSRDILVERHISGTDYRITVVDGQVVKAISRTPGGVVGDGKSTVAELVEYAGQTPIALQRRRDRGQVLLSLDDEARELLSEQQLTANSVPARGRMVPLRRRANVSTGGSTGDVFASMHPDNARLAINVAEILRLDIAGIDFIMPDIGVSWLEGGGAICEVNAQPQIGLEFVPNIFRDLLKSLFPEGPRVPSLLFIGGEDHRRDLEQLAGALAGQLADMGVAAAWIRDGQFWMGNNRFSPAGDEFVSGGYVMMANPRTQVAILVATDTEILKQGIPTTKIDAVLILDTDAENGEAVSKRLEVWRLIQPAVAGGSVILASNANAPLVAQITQTSQPTVNLAYFPQPGDLSSSKKELTRQLAALVDIILQNSGKAGCWMGENL